MADATLPQRLNRPLFRVALFFGALFLALSGFGPVMDNVDLGWHVAQGRWMAERAAFYRHDFLNYPTYGRPVVNEYTLFQLVLFFFWKLGWWGPCLLTALGYGALIALFIRAGRAWAEGSAAFILALGAMFLYLRLESPLRPHLFTYLGIVALGLFLLRHRNAPAGREAGSALLLQAAWANCHGGFVLGPMMATLFGLEMTVRAGWRDRAQFVPTARRWAGFVLLLVLACCLNPAGPAIFYPPLFQARLESIRAFVGEMEPLGGALGLLYLLVTGLAVTAVLGAWWRRGAMCWSFLILAALLLFESWGAKKSWPVFGLLPPLLVLGSGAFSRRAREGPLLPWLNLAGNFALASLAFMALIGELDPVFPGSLAAAWREHDAGRSDLSLLAARWMRHHGIDGRLLHRCEDGGWLQEEGYDRGQTFGDTGFGKYDESSIRTVALVGERPDLLPRYLAAYRPAYVVDDNYAFAWPCRLRGAGWRLIFYSPYGCVWTQPGTRPDLPTVTDAEIEAAFKNDLAEHGMPASLSLLGRSLLKLNALGLEDFAFGQLTGLPAEWHRAAWYWEAARILCFDPPGFSAAHRAQLVAEAEALPDPALTAEFRAYARAKAGDAEGARKILAALPADRLTDHAAERLLQIELAEGRPEARALAENTKIFDTRDGRHWGSLAQAEERAGHDDQAASAWRKAVFYYPDDEALMREAAAFAARTRDAQLQRDIAEGVALPLPGDAPAPPAR